MILIITQNNNENKNNYNNNDDDDESRGLQKFNPENFKGASVLYHVPYPYPIIFLTLLLLNNEG